MARTIRRSLLGALALLAACADDLAPPPAVLALSASRVALRAQAGAPGVAEATVDLAAADGRRVEPPAIGIAYQGEAGWLEAAAAPLGGSWRITLRAVAASLAAGHREAAVTLTCAGAAAPAVVAVALDVDPAPPVLVVSPGSVTFEAEQGAADPAPQLLLVRLEGGAGPAPTAEIRPADASAAWLSASVAEATGGWSLTLSASVAGLAPGAHEAAVLVASAGAVGSPAEVAVTLQVAPTTAALAVAPAELRFSAVEGSEPAPQRVVAFVPFAPALAATTAELAPAVPWLGIATAPAEGRVDIDVQPSTAGLSPGAYATTLVVTSPGLQGSPAAVPVALTVEPAIPALAVSPPELAFDSSFGNEPPAKVVAVQGIGAGVLPPVTATASLGTGTGWLRVTPGGAGNAQTLTVQPTPSGQVPGTLHGAIEVAAAGAAGSPATVGVTLTVLAATGSRCPPGSTLAWQGGGGGGGGAEPPDFAATFFSSYCTRCHDSTRVGAARNGATPGTDFDTLAGARKAPYSLDIAAAAGPAGSLAFMPPSGPAPTLQERTWLGEWIACGQP